MSLNRRVLSTTFGLLGDACVALMRFTDAIFTNAFRVFSCFFSVCASFATACRCFS